MSLRSALRSAPSFVELEPRAPVIDAKATDRIDPEGRYESERVVVAPIPNAGAVSVYRTQKTWRGIDVFLRLPFDLPVTDMFTVRLYAETRGEKTIVSTGRYGPQAETQRAEARHLIAYRGGAAAFEVELFFNDLPIVTETEAYVSIFAADDLPEPPDGIGCVPLAAGGLMTTAASSLLVAADAQIVSVVATQLVAGPRWLMFFDQGSLPIAAGTAPILAFGLPAGIGQSLPLPPDVEKLFASRRFRSGVAMGVSSTGDVFTAGAAGDVSAQAWVR